MDTSFLVQGGMALVIAGLFAAAFYHFSRPARGLDSRPRVAPQIPGSEGTGTLAVVTSDRRSPTL